MQIPLVVWALSVAFAVGAAQSDEDEDEDEDDDSSPPVEASSSGDGGDAPTSPSSSTPPTAAGSPALSTLFAFPSANGPLPSGPFGGPGSAFRFPFTTSIAAVSAFPSASESAEPLPASESTHFSKGPIIGAAVGGSIAASLVVLAGALFCLRLRTRNTPAPPVEGASDVTRRCEALEREVSMLRERLARLEARGSSSGGAAAATLYTNEKDGLALDGKAVKDQPPSYLD